MYGYIYITTNLINNKKYIGQHKASEFTENYKGSGTRLWNAINKYGWDNFKVEMIEECNSLEELNNREAYWTKYYNAVESDEFYNLREGGNQPGFSEEMRRKISESNKGKSNGPLTKEQKLHLSKMFSGEGNPMYGTISPMKGKHLTEEQKDKLSKSMIGNKNSLGYKHSDESCKKISIAMKGKRNFLDHKHNDKTKTKISESMKGVHKSEDHKKKISETIKGRVWICNDEKSKQIPKSELNYYLSIGWCLGRRKRVMV